MTCPSMPLLGVYLLGAADAGERRAMEQHLAYCPACRAELARLSPLPGLLFRVPADQVPAGLSGPRPVKAAVDGVHLQSRPAVRSAPQNGAAEPGRQRPAPARRWRFAGLVAAAAVAGLAAGIAVAPRGSGVTAAKPPGVGVESATPAVIFAGSDSATNFQATAALMSTSKGSSIDLWLHGRLRGARCELVVDSREGRHEVAGTWNAWAANFVVIPASADWRPSDIANLQLRTPAGELVTMTPSGRGSAGSGAR